jgi:hypothetical protein
VLPQRQSRSFEFSIDRPHAEPWQGAHRIMKPPIPSGEDHSDPSQATQVRHPRRGAIPSPRADIEQAPLFVPHGGTEDEGQTSAVPESDTLNRKA